MVFSVFGNIGGKPYKSTGNICDGSLKPLLKHDASTEKGFSGAPLLQLGRHSKPHVIAIHIMAGTGFNVAFDLNYVAKYFAMPDKTDEERNFFRNVDAMNAIESPWLRDNYDYMEEDYMQHIEDSTGYTRSERAFMADPLWDNIPGMGGVRDDAIEVYGYLLTQHEADVLFPDRDRIIECGITVQPKPVKRFVDWITGSPKDEIEDDEEYTRLLEEYKRGLKRQLLEIKYNTQRALEPATAVTHKAVEEAIETGFQPAEKAEELLVFQEDGKPESEPEKPTLTESQTEPLTNTSGDLKAQGQRTTTPNLDVTRVMAEEVVSLVNSTKFPQDYVKHNQKAENLPELLTAFNVSQENQQNLMKDGEIAVSNSPTTTLAICWQLVACMKSKKRKSLLRLLSARLDLALRSNQPAKELSLQMASDYVTLAIQHRSEYLQNLQKGSTSTKRLNIGKN
jgi:hypothetical protein